MLNENMSDSLDSLVAMLPEIYQPIFNHPELSKMVSRQCGDRLAEITKVYTLIETQLGRPLRVLDLGCAQGFFSFSLAKLGATVHGIDLLDANIAVCQVLANEHPKLKVSFVVDCITDFVASIVADQYDLVMGLSVFHHIVHVNGLVNVQEMLSGLAKKVAFGIFELALASEPLYWAVSQPHNARQLLAGFTFSHELAQHDTHLSPISRPLYVASNQYWCLNNQIGVFDTWQDLPHLLAKGIHQGTRRYFFGNGLIVKLFHLDSLNLRALNTQELSNEIDFLQSPPVGYDAPKLLLHGQNESEAWLVREQLPGELLIDIIHGGKLYDAKSIIQQLLYQLTVLESQNLYHNDVRIWNVLVNSDGKVNLIDYGAITSEAKDCVWPGNIFLAFLIFVYEVVTGLVNTPNPLRTIAISPYRFSQPYRKWLIAFWSYPLEKWSFGLLYQLFIHLDNMEENDLLMDTSSLQHWMLSIESAIDKQVSTIKEIQIRQQQIEEHNEKIILHLGSAQYYTQWLRGEWKVTNQFLEPLIYSNGRLQGERYVALERIMQLETELKSIKVKLDKFSQSPEHQLNAPQGLNLGLKHIYSDKFFWVISLFRQVVRASKWVSTSIKHYIHRFLHCSK